MRIALCQYEPGFAEARNVDHAAGLRRRRLHASGRAPEANDAACVLERSGNARQYRGGHHDGATVERAALRGERVGIETVMQTQGAAAEQPRHHRGREARKRTNRNRRQYAAVLRQRTFGGELCTGRNELSVAARNEPDAVVVLEKLTYAGNLANLEGVEHEFHKGDIADPETRFSKVKAENRNYRLLQYLNVNTRTSYLARIRNPNPKMPDAGAIGVASLVEKKQTANVEHNYEAEHDQGTLNPKSVREPQPERKP